MQQPARASGEVHSAPGSRLYAAAHEARLLRPATVGIISRLHTVPPCHPGRSASARRAGTQGPQMERQSLTFQWEKLERRSTNEVLHQAFQPIQASLESRYRRNARQFPPAPWIPSKNSAAHAKFLPRSTVKSRHKKVAMAGGGAVFRRCRPSQPAGPFRNRSRNQSPSGHSQRHHSSTGCRSSRLAQRSSRRPSADSRNAPSAWYSCSC